MYCHASEVATWWPNAIASVLQPWQLGEPPDDGPLGKCTLLPRRRCRVSQCEQESSEKTTCGRAESSLVKVQTGQVPGSPDCSTISWISNEEISSPTCSHRRLCELSTASNSCIRMVDLYHQVTQVARVSLLQSWVAYTMITAEVPEMLHSFTEVHA